MAIWGLLCLSTAAAASTGRPGALASFRLDGPSRGPRVPLNTRQLALYPLPAVYLPGAQCTLRNIEPRNVAMATERSEFVAALVEVGGQSCARVGSILRIDDVRPAARDRSGKVLASSSEPSGVLDVRCTVVGRAQLVACANLEAWRQPERDEYLVADVLAYEDDEREEREASHASRAGERADAEDEAWWMGASAAGDVADAMYRLVDAILEAESCGGGAHGLASVDDVVASLEEGAQLCEDGEWWAALEVWQTHCATRLASAEAVHRAERN
jgi:Lon protease-like protein